MTSEPIPREADFTYLESSDEYALYYNQLGTVLSRLAEWYRRTAREGNYEAGVVQGFMERLLFTVRALRVKYACHQEKDQLKVDLTDSGFPSALELMSMATDLLRREEILRKLPPEALLKREILDQLIAHRREPQELLWQMSQRAYLEMLEESQLLLAFNSGRLELQEDAKPQRTYVYSWACYDYVTSRPYVHIFTFDQEARSAPLQERGANWEHFMDVMRHEGSRAPSVGILAASIDDLLEDIHPRILKRVCLGPWFSPHLVKSHQYSADPFCRALTELLVKVRRRDDDLIFFFDDEVVFSKSESVRRSILNPRGRVRQLFHIPESDPESYRRRASVVHRNVLLPHVLLQHIEETGADKIPGFSNCHKIAYTEKGEFHGV